MRVLNVSSSATISSTRSSELNPSSSQRRLRREILTARVLRDQRGERVGTLPHKARRAAARDPVANRRALQLAACPRCAAAPARARRARAGSSGDRRASRSPARTTASGSMPGSTTRTACTRSSEPIGTPTTADSRTPAIPSSTRSTSSGKTFSPSGVTIISFLRPRMNSLAVRVDLADVAGVEPAVLERARGLLRGVEVARRHVVAAHEDLAVRRDLRSRRRRSPCRPILSSCRRGGSA